MPHIPAMGLRSWIWTKLGMPELRAEQRRRLRAWEREQANDWDLIESDPLSVQVKAAIDLLDDNPLEAFPRLLGLAQNGSVWSTVLVGWCFGSGTGVDENWEQAEHWYRLAYEAGSEHGLLRYAEYLDWRGDTDSLQKVYEAGWEKGLTPAVFRLIRMRLKPTMTLADRLAWKPALEWAAETGHPGARFLLAKYLSRGWFGVRGIPRGIKLIGGMIAAVFRGDEDRPIPV